MHATQPAQGAPPFSEGDKARLTSAVADLSSSRTRSAEPHPRNGRPATDLSGRTFGRYRVLNRAINGRRGVYWLCECSCGNRREVRSEELKNGSSRSCGCLARELSAQRFVTHGHTRASTGKPSPTWLSWRAMVSRVTNPKTVGWANYGGRGITVCDRWRTFGNFLADMGERPAGTTLDRIDNDGNYGPGNCRWATPTEQTANRRNRHDGDHGQSRDAA